MEPQVLVAWLCCREKREKKKEREVRRGIDTIDRVGRKMKNGKNGEVSTNQRTSQRKHGKRPKCRAAVETDNVRRLLQSSSTEACTRMKQQKTDTHTHRQHWREMMMISENCGGNWAGTF